MKALYLEPDEEITSVVDRLKEIDDEEVAIVVPKRAGLLQSIVNLKLLRYQAEQQQKRISLVTTDKTGRNLASAVGLTVYQKLPEGRIKGRKNLPTESAIKEPTEEIPIKFRKQPPKESAASSQPDADDITYKEGATPEIVTREISDDQFTKVTETDDGVEVDTAEVITSTEAISDDQPAADEVPEKTKIPVQSAVTQTDEPKPEQKSGRSLRSSLKVPKVSLPKVKIPKPKKREKTPGGSGKKVGWKIAAAVVVALLLTGTAAAAVMLPKATVTVTPKTTPVKAEVPLTFSSQAPAVDPEGNVIPAKTIEITKNVSKQVTATGQAGGEKASGDITVVNSLPRNQSLVARTRFQAPDGRVYRAQSSVVVPARSETTVRVVADEGGEAGNLPAGTALTIPGLRSTNAVTAKVDTPLTGGTDSASKTISEADVERAQQELAAQAAQEGVGDAKSKLAVGYEINPQVASTSVLSSTANPPAGTAAAKFTVSGQVKVTYFTYQQQDLDKVLGPDVATKVPAGAELVDTQADTFAVKQASDNQLSGTMGIDTFAATNVSKEQIKEAIKGKSPEEAKTELESDGQITNVSISLFPFWVTSVPGSLDKIIIEFTSGTADATLPTPSPTASPDNPSSPPQI